MLKKNSTLTKILFKEIYKAAGELDKCTGGIYVKKTKFKQFQCDHMFHPYSIPFQSLLPSHLKPKDFTSPNKTLNLFQEIFCIYKKNGASNIFG